MTRYEQTRDLAQYRHNTRRWMRAHRTLLRLPAVRRPEWTQRSLAKTMSGPTEGELRALWGNR
jgi:hypothetical protein